jgi:4'-phosphopantetheinyl transferase EntD
MFIPHDAVLVEVLDPDLRAHVLPEELSALGERAVDIRRRDFSLGRHCAREALAILGADVGPILIGPSREPLWPKAVCGSITHCQGYWAAAVAWKSNVRSIGIDAEPLRRLPRNVVKLIATEAEIRRNEQATDGLPWDAILFSAKESVYKAWFPIVGKWLGFEQVEIEFLPATNEFRAYIDPGDSAAPPGLREVHGRYEIGSGHIFTCTYVMSK